MKVIYEQSPAVWRICETSVLRVTLVESYLNSKTHLLGHSLPPPLQSMLICKMAWTHLQLTTLEGVRGERTSELRLRGVSQLIMFGRLPYTFDRTLTASPVPLRVGLRCGMGASVIKNIGRRWEAKRTLQTFFVWEWCCRRKCRKLKFLHPPEPGKFFPSDKSQLDTTFSRCA